MFISLVNSICKSSKCKEEGKQILLFWKRAVHWYLEDATLGLIRRSGSPNNLCTACLFQMSCFGGNVLTYENPRVQRVKAFLSHPVSVLCISHSGWGWGSWPCHSSCGEEERNRWVPLWMQCPRKERQKSFSAHWPMQILPQSPAMLTDSW